MSLITFLYLYHANAKPNDLGMGYLIIVKSKMYYTFGINNMINWKDNYTLNLTSPLFF